MYTSAQPYLSAADFARVYACRHRREGCSFGQATSGFSARLLATSRATHGLIRSAPPPSARLFCANPKPTIPLPKEPNPSLKLKPNPTYVLTGTPIPTLTRIAHRHRHRHWRRHHHALDHLRISYAACSQTHCQFQRRRLSRPHPTSQSLLIAVCLRDDIDLQSPQCQDTTSSHDGEQILTSHASRWVGAIAKEPRRSITCMLSLTCNLSSLALCYRPL